MPLPASGSISLSQIQTEFGGSNPISINEYYKGGFYVSTNDNAPNVPTSGQIALSNFYGASKAYAPTAVEYLVVAGGGGAGGCRGGGGGAGGFRTATGLSVTTGVTYTVTVGGGGSGGPAAVADPPFYSGYGSEGRGTQGSNSVFSSITSTGGGYGTALAFPDSSKIDNGGSGGSGGGGNARSGVRGSGGTGTAGQGNNGGEGYSGGEPFNGGGGGGASAAGGSNVSAAAGGNGTASSISGSSVTYAGGGGAGGYYPNPGKSGPGGSGGGGGGATKSGGTGTAGTANSGGGGGGGDNSGAGGAGGSGIVIIRYADTSLPATATTGNPTYTVSGGYRIYQWTGSGSIRW